MLEIILCPWLWGGVLSTVVALAYAGHWWALTHPADTSALDFCVFQLPSWWRLKRCFAWKMPFMDPVIYLTPWRFPWNIWLLTGTLGYLVVVNHEERHCLQWEDFGWGGFLLRWLIPRGRFLLEAEAFAVSVDTYAVFMDNDRWVADYFDEKARSLWKNYWLPKRFTLLACKFEIMDNLSAETRERIDI